MDILHHHHRPIHQDAEVDRADREQVRRNVPQVETDRSEEERQRDGHRHDEPGAGVHQEEDQDQHHQHDPARQVPRHRPNSEMDQVAPVVERVDLHVFREHRLVELVGLGLHAPEHRLGLLPGAHEHHALHGVGPVVEAEKSQAGRVADLHPPDVTHQDRGTVLDREHYAPDVLRGHQAPQPAHVVELPALGVEAAASVAVVGPQRGRDGGNGKPGAGHFGRVKQHLVLHGLPAEWREVRDARHRLVRFAQDPVLDGLELHRRAVGAVEDVPVHQPRRREERRDARGHPLGHLDVAEPLEHLLAREVRIGAVPEHHPDIRETVEGDGPLHVEPGQAVHLGFHRNREQPLDFLGGMARPLGDNLHLRRREVGIGIDRKP